MTRVVLLAAAAVALALPQPAIAAAQATLPLGGIAFARLAPAQDDRDDKDPIDQRLAEVDEIIAAAEKMGKGDPVPTEAALAKRVVEGELSLAEGNAEGALIAFLDVVENHPESIAAAQAIPLLGTALVRMDLPLWAAEMFSKNLADQRPDAKRFHQRSVAQLFDLAVPRQADGFARRPGLSATPEVRARLQAVGVDVVRKPPKGKLGREDADRLIRWAKSFADREARLRYSFGRYLFLTGRHSDAIVELDGLSPLDTPISKGGPDAAWRIRGSYVAAAATLAAGFPDEALERYGRIVRARPSESRDRQIVDLSIMAIGRIQHDAGETEDAVKAYKRISRDSPFFPEAMYETAWTLLRARQFDRAVQALDLLLVYDPRSPIAAEIKQLRGKVRIQQGDYAMAEDEFLALRREYDAVAKRLGRKLASKADATEYFSAVVAEDMEHFSLASILPMDAVPLANGLPRAVHAQDLAREVGKIERELDETRTLLSQMEEAVGIRDKGRLFPDLAAHFASLDRAEADVLDVQELLVQRRARAAKADTESFDRQSRELRARVDRPLGKAGAARSAAVERIQKLDERVHKLDLFVASMRAELVAAEHYYEETRADQKIDHVGFLKEATALRDMIAGYEAEVISLRGKLARARTGMRDDSAVRDARAQAALAYRRHLAAAWGSAGKSKGGDEADDWQRTAGFAERIDKARAALNEVGARRLVVAIRILTVERKNLDAYLVELRATKADTRRNVADVLAAAYSDVVGEMENLVLRSEVGLLDVAWGMKEAETSQIETLQRERDRDLGELDRAIEMGLEDLRP